MDEKQNIHRLSKRRTPVRSEQKQVREPDQQSPAELVHPTSDDSAEWHVYWQAQNQSWRTEREIGSARQDELSARLATTAPAIEKGFSPFQGLALSRADIEWLLSRHDKGVGPIDWNNESQREREGLDVRGADLHNQNLSNLPLACLCGSLTFKELSQVTIEQHRSTTILLEGVNLIGAQLEGADLRGAQLERATLHGAQLKRANLRQAQLRRTDLIGAQLEGADLSEAQLEGADFRWAQLERAILYKAQLKGADLSDAQLKRVNLSQAQLEIAILHRAQLEGADLSQAQLKRADLSQAQLEGANLSGAQLKEVDLRGAQLKGANLSQAQLEGADLSGAQLKGADLRGAQLNRANLSQAQMEEADLHGALLMRADLSDAQLKRADLRGVELKEARLFGVQLEGANLSRAQLEGANLSGAQLEGANLSGAQLKGVDLRGALLKGANLSQAQLGGADLSGAQLEGANLSKTQLEGTNLSGAQLKGVNLNQAQLGGADLSGAQLEGANLSKTQLEGTNLSGAQLKGGDLRGAQLKGANLSRAQLEGADLQSVILSNDQHIGPRLADVQWGVTNLAVVDWSQISMLGDEWAAREKKTNNRGKKEKSIPLFEYQTAVRANRQLAVALQAQGLNEDAARFSYRAHILQRKVFWYQMFLQPEREDEKKPEHVQVWKWLVGGARRLRKFGSYILSFFLDKLAGYGYMPGRTLGWYLLVVLSYAGVYFKLEQVAKLHLSFIGAIIFSITAFHGRGFFPGGFGYDDLVTILAATEAVVGLLIELSFIATFTQRFFGK